jgi:tetratricopeptide (TPR) repeat protein
LREDILVGSKLEAEGRWMELVKLLVAQAEAAGRDDKPVLYLRLAGVYHDRFTNMAESIKAYERVLEYDPANLRAIAQLRALYEKRRDWEKLLELEKGELDRTEPDKRRDKAVESARMAAAHVGKSDITIYWWQRVLEYEPDHRHARAELEQAFERGERWMELTSVLEQQAELAQGNDDRIAALRRLATVREAELEDLHAARASWQELLDVEPKDPEAKRAIARIDAAESAPPASVAVAKTGAGLSSVDVDKPPSVVVANPASSPAVENATSARPPKSEPHKPVAGAAPSSTLTIVIVFALLALIAGAIYFVTRT